MEKGFYTFASVCFAAIAIYTGVTEGKPLFGVVMAVAAVVLVQLWRLWDRFWAKHQKLGKTLLWVLGIIFVILLSMAGVPVISLAIGAAILIAFINAFPGIRRREKQKTEKRIEESRQYWQQDTENYRRKKALDEQKRKAARAEAENLEEMARLWERNAKKYGKASDIQKARDFRERANAAWRKLH